jgi:SAM-dependent methyltransferase
MEGSAEARRPGMDLLLRDRRTDEPPWIAPSVEWEETPCLLCGGRTAETIVEAGDPLRGAAAGPAFRVVRCHECELCYTNPRPSPASIGRFYPDDYSPHQYRATAFAKKRWHPWRRREPFPEMVPAPLGGRLLDFGCGAGENLHYLHRRGWRVTGLDVSPRMVCHVRQTLGLAALEGTLPHPDLAPGSFEAITMWQSLEHVHDPLRVLREAHRLLTPGGRVVIAVPNIESLPFRWFGADWFGLELPRHLTHFSPRTLGRMLERAGFYAGPVRLIRHNGWLRRSARLARRHPGRHPLWRRLLRYRLPASLAGWYTALRGRENCILAVGVRP